MEKRRIGIVSLGYAWLPCEPGPSRFYYIAKVFSEAGWDVDFIGTSFQHFNKAPRDKELIAQQQYPFKVTYIEVPPYKKNIDLRRVFSNAIAKGRVIEYLATQKYDVIYNSIPANDVSAAVAQYCSRNAIPLIVDIEDLWPEAMEMVVKNDLLRKIVFPQFHRDAETAYMLADAVIGTAEDYTGRATKYNHRQDIICKTVYVGCDMSVFDAGVSKYSNEIDKPENEFWVTYAGSIGTSYDIKTLVLAGKELLKRGQNNIRIKILGTGPLKVQLEELAIAEQCKNVEFLGYVEYPKMAAYLSQSDVVVNSFVKGAPQSIVNKIGDYLASGHPMINTLENPVFVQLVEKYQVGINIEPDNIAELANAIELLNTDMKLRTEMGDNARKLCEERFDRKVAYQAMIDVACTITDHASKAHSAHNKYQNLKSNMAL